MDGYTIRFRVAIAFGGRALTRSFTIIDQIANLPPSGAQAFPVVLFFTYTRKQQSMIPVEESGRECGCHSVVITDAKPYNGCTGRIVGLTALLPAWYIVDLDSGGRVVVRPGHCEPLAGHRPPRSAPRCATCDLSTTGGRHCETCQPLVVCALQGVQLLDECATGWQCWPGLNLEMLDMEWHGLCLLSQLFGSYQEGIERLDLGPLLIVGPVNFDSYGWQHGFTIPPYTPQEQVKAAFARLTTIWKQIVLENRKAKETRL